MGCGSSLPKTKETPKRANSLVPPMKKAELIQTMKNIQADNGIQRNSKILKFNDNEVSEINYKPESERKSTAEKSEVPVKVSRQPVKRVTIHTKSFIITKTESQLFQNATGSATIEIKTNNTLRNIGMRSTQVLEQIKRPTFDHLVFHDATNLIRQHRLSILENLNIEPVSTQEHSYIKLNKEKEKVEFFGLKGNLKQVMKTLILGHSLKDKSTSIKTLDNKIIDSINYSVKRIKRYYKKQKPPINNEKFNDNLFPPTSDSIYGMRNGEYVEKNDDRRIIYMNDFPFWKEDIVWLRAKEIFPGGIYSVFTNEVDVDDVRQGIIGNCYFMSSMAALTEYPQLIYQLFRNFTKSDNGYFEIGARIDGKWQIVIVDDYFPCFRKTNQPIFAKPRGSELWVMLLEKVWAKINGGYLNITGGWATEVLQCFTSFPIQSITHKKTKPEIIWEQIKYAEDNGYIMACCSQFKSDIQSNGLIPGHAFTLISAKEVMVENKKVQLMQLRNPWGYKEWNGPWSDGSKEWTMEAKLAFLKFNHRDDGVFWMCYEDFLKYFIVTEFCRVSYPQCVKSITIERSRVSQPNVFELHIFRKCEINISALKKSYRFHRAMPKDAELIINMIIVKKNEFGKFEYIASTHENEANPSIELELHHGYYLIYVHADYTHSNYDKKRKYNLYISSTSFFDIYEKGVDENFFLLKEILISKLDDEKTKPNSTYSFKEENGIKSILIHKFESTTYGLHLIENNKEVDINMELKNHIENFDIVYPYNLIEKRMISAKTHEIKETEYFIIIGIRGEYYEKYSFKMIYSIEDNKENTLGSLQKLTEECDEGVANFVQNVQNVPHDEEAYDFYYKVIDIDPENIIEKINHIEVAENYFLSKFPQEMAKILEIPRLEDKVEVIFRDLYDYGSSVYLGEWDTKNDLVKHGRGWFIWGDGSSYLGQIKHNSFEGMGEFFYLNGDHCKITFKEGKMHGKGIYYNTNGVSHDVTYENGNLKE
jgi:hypothetical protein